MTDLRCPSKLHGVLDNQFIDVKCSSRFCGAQPGVVIIHRFSAIDGGFIDTMRFRDPAKGNANE